VTLTHFSLFTGIGGIDLAAEWAGFETVGQCEWADYPTKVLEKHWPDVQRWRDVRDLTVDSYVNVLYNKLSINDKEEVDMVAHRKDYDEAVGMYNKGLSIQNVADFYEITRQAMWMILKRRGCEFRPQQKGGEDNHFYRGGSKASDLAQNLLETALLQGIVTRKAMCEKCGSTETFKDGRTAIQAHHVDYNKPLEVLWLCQKCHHEWHKGNIPIERKKVMPNEISRRTNIDLLSGGFP
jgi:uncharacterized protein with PIN domain